MRFIAFIAGSLASAAALGQPTFDGAGELAFEAFADGAWRRGDVVVTERSIPIRLAASWSFDAGYGFWRTKADVVVAGPEGALDDAVNLRRVFPFNYGGQTLAATRFGNVLKLDDVRDTLPAGQGTHGIIMDQLMESLNAFFSRANPAHIFDFVLELDDVPGPRRVESVHYELSWGNTTDRVMRIYTSETGAFNLPRTVRVPLNLYYIPSPGGAALLLGALCVRRPRRRAGDQGPGGGAPRGRGSTLLPSTTALSPSRM